MYYSKVGWMASLKLLKAELGTFLCVHQKSARDFLCYNLKGHDRFSCDVSILHLTGFRITPLGSVEQCPSGSWEGGHSEQRHHQPWAGSHTGRERKAHFTAAAALTHPKGSSELWFTRTFLNQFLILFGSSEVQS